MSRLTFDAERLKQLMISRGLSLAVAESLTCGHVQAVVGSVSGASDFFLGGMTAYCIPQKVKHLSVDEAHAMQVDAVSARVAEEMAKGVAALFGSSYSVATTGYAERPPSGPDTVPFAHVAIWEANESGGSIVFRDIVRGPGLNRVEMQQHVASVVLEALLAHLEALP